MIENLTYEEVLSISQDLKEQAKIIETLASTRNIQELKDFSATVEGYSKFLENTIKINKDADYALKELKSQLK